MFYNARWYDPSIMQFNQPDTLIPDPYQPNDWNRYQYARGNPISYKDPSGHTPWYINGWKSEYAQKQNGNTCAVVSMAVSLSIVYGTKLTQDEVQGLYPNTYLGIGVVPFQQTVIDLDLTTEATYSQGTRADLLQNLNNNLPTIVSLALPGWDIGHAIVAIGFDPATSEIIFFNPATGMTAAESQILKDYDKKRGFATFDDLWAASNMFIKNNSMVTIEKVPLPPLNMISPSMGGGGGIVRPGTSTAIELR